VAGIIIAIAAIAAVTAISAAQMQTHSPQDNGNSTSSKPRQIDVNLGENLTVKAK
jgi:hypothetical protein